MKKNVLDSNADENGVFTFTKEEDEEAKKMIDSYKSQEKELDKMFDKLEEKSQELEKKIQAAKPEEKGDLKKQLKTVKKDMLKSM